MDRIKGYLVIPVWLVLSAGSTFMLGVGKIIGYFKKGDWPEPYFKVRAICDVDDKYKGVK